MPALHYFETHSLDPAYNLAFEETVLRRRREGDHLILWQNADTIVIGQNQNTAAEIDRTFVEEHHIHVVRRMTGGGAVYHDLGNLNYSFITDFSEYQHQRMEVLTAPVVAALRSVGLEAEATGRNDILAEGLKVSGTAQRILDGRILHHGTLLFRSDLDMVSRALRADPRKFQSKSAKSVRSRVGNIYDLLPEPMDIQEFWARLKAFFAQDGMVEDALTEEELAEVRQLKQSRYDTWEWTYGRSPRYDMCSSDHFPGGLLEARVGVHKGQIETIVFYGDFLSLEPLDGLQDALTGCLFERQAVRAVLERFPLPRLFGSITEEEILQVLFA